MSSNAKALTRRTKGVRRRRWLRPAATAVTAALVVGLGGGAVWLRTSLPLVSGEIRVAGLGKVVEIVRDRHAIPHIRASSMADAYFALGFVHAQDRLFQMDLARRAGAGRLAEIFGARAVGSDRAMRILGIGRLAESSLAALAPEVRTGLSSYAAGVNAFLEAHAGALPPEFVALGYRPEPWREADSLIWPRMMAFQLSGNWRGEAVRGRLAGKLRPEQIADLFLYDDGGAPPTLAAALPDEADRMLAELITDMPRSLRPVTASNSWAVDGAHSATGKPILVNDPHLPYRAPGTWYLARIETPELALTGVTVAGVPVTLLGHNGRIAWAFTTTESDTQDLYVERLDPADPSRYLAPEGSRPFEARTEIIRVSGAPPVSLIVRETRHGPVVSDIGPRFAAPEPGHVIALAAAALRPGDRTAEALWGVNRARDWAAFRDALRLYQGPQQNITYADTAGNVGFIAPALVPIRRSGDGSAPSPGWTADHDWIGFIPFDELPQALNPPHGRIVNANHRIVGSGYRYFLGHVETPPYRARRIHELLDAAPKFAPADATRMLMDPLSTIARDLLPRLLTMAPRDGRQEAALSVLRGWDGMMRRDRPEPLIFVAWVREIERALYADETGDLFPQLWDMRADFIARALASRNEWCDDVTTSERETCTERLQLALDRALDMLTDRHGSDLAAWKWGDAHRARFPHAIFGFVPILSDFTEIALPVDGGADTINRAQFDFANDATPFAAVHGPGYRAVYDLADLDRSLFTQATGESGNPLSRRYSDLTMPWRDGPFIRISGRRDEALAGAVGILRLVPRRQSREESNP
jgi:penicillin amidase